MYFDLCLKNYEKKQNDTSDSQRINRAINDCGDGVLFIEKGEYLIDEPIVITNGCCLMLHKSATLKAVKKMDFIITIDCEHSKDEHDFMGEAKEINLNLNQFFSGGVLDGNGLASCIKHFPGYGENTDTHKGTAHDSRELYEFYNRDFVPFEAGINADPEKTPAVMVGHTIYDLIEPDVPASLSPEIHKVLREKLGFNGVVITDDLGMDAISDYSGEQSVYVSAVLADNDMLCVSEPETAYADLVSAYEEGVITDDMLDAHVKRIIIMKLQYGIM